MRKRRGFTLIELMVVTILLGILASIALLKYLDMRNHAIAAQMSQELRAITVAVINYHAGTDAWPAEVGAGTVPVELNGLLPGQLASSFDRTQYLLDYENFGPSATTVMIGVAVTSNDPKLFAKFVQYMGTQSPFFVSGSKMTYLISGPGGIF
jgi:prepilin-type N-terminal cleavage/methylation domain-containing protein